MAGGTPAMKTKNHRCKICQAFYQPHPRNAKKNKSWGQKTCGKRKCRLAWQRKQWQRWIKLHPTYRKTKDWRQKVQAWATAYPNYWRHYRATHPNYVKRDKQRRVAARHDKKVSAKQRAMRQVVVDKLRILDSLKDAEMSAKQRPIARRVDAIEDCLRSTAEILLSAKPKPMDANISSAG